MYCNRSQRSVDKVMGGKKEDLKMAGVSSWGSQWRDMAEDSKEPFFWPPFPSSMGMLLLHDLLHFQYCKIILQYGRSFLQDTRGFTDLVKVRNMVGIHS